MPAELVLPDLSGLSDRSRPLESASAYHQVAPKSDEACRRGEPSPAHPAPAPRRHGAYERWLLARDIQRGGGGQSVEWFLALVYHARGRLPEAKAEMAKLQAIDGDAGALWYSRAGLRAMGRDYSGPELARKS